MKQTDLGLNLTTKRTLKQDFFAQVERVVPQAALVDLAAPYAPEVQKGSLLFASETMLRLHLMQQWLLPADYLMTIHAVSGYLGRGPAGLEDHECVGAAIAAPFQACGLGLYHKHVPEVQQHASLTQAPVSVPACRR